MRDLMRVAALIGISMGVRTPEEYHYSSRRPDPDSFPHGTPPQHKTTLVEPNRATFTSEQPLSKRARRRARGKASCSSR